MCEGDKKNTLFSKVNRLRDVHGKNPCVEKSLLDMLRAPIVVQQ